MKMRIRDEAAGAKGGVYKYKNPEDGYMLQHPTVGHLENMARQYRRTNSYPIGVNWDADFVENVCQNTPPPSCVEDGPPSIVARAASLTAAFASWAKQGFQLRSEEEANRVWGICKTCEYYGGSRSLLRVACKKCACSGAKLFMASTRCPAGKW